MLDALGQLKTRHLRGETGGMVSVCSSHPMVLQTSLQMAREKGIGLLVEATANQVNQSGGYTGMRPAEFVRHIGGLAREAGLPDERIIIGADHLGPHVWKHEPAAMAMQKSEELIRHCVLAGFQKIHLDTGARCADDPGPALPLDVIAERAARLCRAAEQTCAGLPGRAAPWYVIGNEVPAPGGALEQGQTLEVTDPDELMSVLEAYAQAFAQAGASAAWQRVLAVVVQPGVDFGDRRVAPYRAERTVALSTAHERLPGMMTYEIHATDYQLPTDLRQMVADHFMLLKVGPCLTFAMRQALYALADIESSLHHSGSPSNLKQVMERLMIAYPEHWRSFYARAQTSDDPYYLRHYSLRDRIRYYWPRPDAQSAVQRLMANLDRRIPSALLQQFLPDLHPHIQPDERPIDPSAVVRLRIRHALMPYLEACEAVQPSE
jgi:D-tagatose-1,6-bisphosphate aldolase subunit GatZ/KbaZ